MPVDPANKHFIVVGKPGASQGGAQETLRSPHPGGAEAAQAVASANSPPERDPPPFVVSLGVKPPPCKTVEFSPTPEAMDNHRGGRETFRVSVFAVFNNLFCKIEIAKRVEDLLDGGDGPTGSFEALGALRRSWTTWRACTASTARRGDSTAAKVPKLQQRAR